MSPHAPQLSRVAARMLVRSFKARLRCALSQHLRLRPFRCLSCPLCSAVSLRCCSPHCLFPLHPSPRYAPLSRLSVVACAASHVFDCLNCLLTATVAHGTRPVLFHGWGRKAAQHTARQVRLAPPNASWFISHAALPGRNPLAAGPGQARRMAADASSSPCGPACRARTGAAASRGSPRSP